MSYWPGQKPKIILEYGLYKESYKSHGIHVFQENLIYTT